MKHPHRTTGAAGPRPRRRQDTAPRPSGGHSRAQFADPRGSGALVGGERRAGARTAQRNLRRGGAGAGRSRWWGAREGAGPPARSLSRSPGIFHSGSARYPPLRSPPLRTRDPRDGDSAGTASRARARRGERSGNVVEGGAEQRGSRPGFTSAACRGRGRPTWGSGEPRGWEEDSRPRGVSGCEGPGRVAPPAAGRGAARLWGAPGGATFAPRAWQSQCLSRQVPSPRGSRRRPGPAAPGAPRPRGPGHADTPASARARAPERVAPAASPLPPLRLLGVATSLPPGRRTARGAASSAGPQNGDDGGCSRRACSLGGGGYCCRPCAAGLGRDPAGGEPLAAVAVLPKWPGNS